MGADFETRLLAYALNRPRHGKCRPAISGKISGAATALLGQWHS